MRSRLWPPPIRSLMVLVAASAIGMALWRLDRLHNLYLARARQHARAERICSESATRTLLITPSYDMLTGRVPMPPYHGPCLSPRLQAHHAALKTKYLRAARFPWLPVTPDPPEPK